MPFCGRCRSGAHIAGSDHYNGVRDPDAPTGLEAGETCDECGASGGGGDE